MVTPLPTEWDKVVHDTVCAVLTRTGVSDVTDVAFDYSVGGWTTSVTPHRAGSAPFVVIAEPDNELNLTVGRTWLEVWGVDNPVEWLDAVVQAVVEGRLEEAGNSRVRIDTRIGVKGGGDVLLIPWRWHRIRRYLPYREDASAVTRGSTTLS